MTQVIINISDTQLLTLLLEARKGNITLENLLDAVFQCGMQFYNGEGQL